MALSCAREGSSWILGRTYSQKVARHWSIGLEQDAQEVIESEFIHTVILECLRCISETNRSLIALGEYEGSVQ